MKDRIRVFLVLIIVSSMGIASPGRAETAIFKIKSNSQSSVVLARPGNKILGHKEVIEKLWAEATSDQADFIAQLELLKRNGGIESYRRFWITNAVSVTAPRGILDQLASRPDIESVFDDLPIRLIDPVETGDAGISSTGHEIGLDAIRAPRAWELGLDGAGSLVCNFDTGVNGNHAALITKYRGNNGGTSAECWFDPYSNTQYPTDLHGHGTHTMGTMVGSDGPDTVGVAPGAQWIAAAVVDRGGGIQRTITDILAAFEWAADPDGDPSTTDDVPDVVNNSWGVPLGYYPACNTTFWSAIDNLEAAGVVCVFAAGNEGPYPSSIRTPADRITTDFNSFCVGAVNGNLPDLPIASFSSRGPSGCDGNTIKPEVSAPGVSVRSTSRTGGYVTMSGTSMATPHVSGAVAILRQFNPQATPSQIKQALMYSARDLGLAGEDNDYGWGAIDIRRALNFMPPPEGIFPAPVDVVISGDGIADPGENVALNLVIENLGRPATNLAAELVAPDARVTVLSGNISIGVFDHNDTITAGPFEIGLSPNITVGESLPLVLNISYSGDVRSANFKITAGGATEPGVATHENGLFKMSISNIGQFGLGDGSVNPIGGEGFRFPPNGPDFLKNGTLMLTADRYHVSDGAYSSNPLISDNDFAPILGGYPRITEPGLYSDQDGFAAYSDSAAESPMGLVVTQRSFCWTGQFEAPLVIVEFTIENTSQNDIDSLLVGIFSDWDLPLSSGSDDVVGYVDYESLGYIMDLSTGVAVGVKAITSEPRSYAAIDNTVWLIDGFTELEKYNFMVSGFGNVSNNTPGNYSHLIAVGPFRIPRGESETVAFSMLAGNNLDELTANAERSFDLYSGFTNADDEAALPMNYKVISNYPNPFNSSTIIELKGKIDQDQNVEIYDIAGRLVKNLPTGGKSQVVWSGDDNDGREVSAGIYFARLSTGKTNVRKMVYLK